MDAVQEQELTAAQLILGTLRSDGWKLIESHLARRREELLAKMLSSEGNVELALKAEARAYQNILSQIYSLSSQAQTTVLEAQK